jgi:hypothetical protein
MGKFKIGDLIIVKEGVHENGMPESRMGLVISEWSERHGPDRNPRHKFTSIYKIQMVNGHQMKMHEMFLEIVQEGTSEEE